MFVMLVIMTYMMAWQAQVVCSYLREIRKALDELNRKINDSNQGNEIKHSQKGNT